MQLFARFAIALSALTLTGSGARAAEDVAEFYKGKQVSIIIASAPGGGYDLYARLVGRHIGKYIPGNPRVVMSNMPGAGGNTAAAYVANIAPKDGTVIGAVHAGTLLDQLISSKGDLVRHDARKLAYIAKLFYKKVCIYNPFQLMLAFKLSISTSREN